MHRLARMPGADAQRSGESRAQRAQVRSHMQAPTGPQPSIMGLRISMSKHNWVYTQDSFCKSYCVHVVYTMEM